MQHSDLSPNALVPKHQVLLQNHLLQMCTQTKFASQLWLLLLQTRAEQLHFSMSRCIDCRLVRPLSQKDQGQVHRSIR